jgi:heavy metal translocating P-type ATPase
MALASAAALAISLSGAPMLPVDPAWIAIALCGAPIVYGAAKALILEGDAKADMLVSMALIASVAIGEYFAAGEVALIMQIGSLLEDATAERARRGIESLASLAPQTARVVRGGKEEIVSADEVEEGDLAVVLAGESIPADGVVLSGSAAVDESMVTGESAPIEKGPGDALVSGSATLYGSVEMRAAKAGRDSTYQRMARLAMGADARKAPIVRLADRWAGWMVGAALASMAATYLFTGEIVRAVTVLVVFCPCAFVLATPTAVMACLANAAKRGILIRSGEGVERLSKLDAIAFDKTGTLTFGRPKVAVARSLSTAQEDGRVLSLAASAEQRSEHPYGKAIVEEAKRRGAPLLEAADFSMRAGLGVQSSVEGTAVAVGNAAYLKSLGISVGESAAERGLQGEMAGAACAYVAAGGELIGFVCLTDEMRPEAPAAVRELAQLGLSAILLSGDKEEAARRVAGEAGIRDVRAGLLPEGKLKAVEECKAKGVKLAMVGDGVNDALALKASYAGIAMGGIGSDIAVESSEAILLSDDLARLPWLIRMSRKCMKKVGQNIAISLAVNALAVLASALGLLSPASGAIAHNIGSVFVVANAALLLREEGGGGAKGARPMRSEGEILK